MADISKITALDGVTYNIKDAAVPAWAKAASKPTYAANEIGGGYLNIHPENSPVLIPFMNNDLAFSVDRGYSAKVFYDSVEQTSLNIRDCFDGSGSYGLAINPSTNSVTEVVVEVTCPQTFTWSSWIYIDFGSSSWRAKNIKLEIMNDSTSYPDDVWTTKDTVTGNTKGNYAKSVSHIPVGAQNAGGGFNKIRFTLSDWQTATIFRISEIGVYNYASLGLRNTYMSRGKDDLVYRNIRPNANDTFTLGDSSHKWKDVYTGTINGTTVPSSPKFTDTNYVPSGGTAGQVLIKNSSTNYDVTWGTGGSGVYVGTSEPSDPNINVWVDTDGPTDTFVKSVNGQAGDVTVGTLPAVTSSDNGKILAVVNGAWVAQTLSQWQGGNY